MERRICNCCNKEITYCPVHITARAENPRGIFNEDWFTLCKECYEKVFNIKEE